MSGRDGKSRFSWYLGAVLLVLLVGAGPALGDMDKIPSTGRQVERIVELEPLPDAEVLVPEFKAFFFSDGSVTISGKGSERVGTPTHGFEYQVDLLSGTYTTRRLDPSEIVEYRPTERSIIENRRQQPPRNGALGVITEEVSPGDWWGRIRVQTKDPPQCVLTETATELTWRVYSNGTVAWLRAGDSCSAAYPSCFGTYWAISYCQHGSPWYGSSSYVCNDNRGNYYNYDFGDNSQRTDVSQWAWMCGRNDAYYDYNWSHNDSGEYAWLIYGSVVLN